MLKRLLSDSVSLVFGNLEAVFKVCGSWFVLQFVLMTIIQLSIGDSGRLEANPGAAVLLSLVVMIFSLVSSASISVAWHRFGLIGEQPGLIHLKFSGVEFSFVLKSLLLGLLMIGAWLVVMLIHFTIGAPAITGVFALLVMAFAIPTFFRFSLILPATAVERPIGLGQAYAISEGLGWRMFLATIILALPFVLGGMFIGYLLQEVAGGLPLLLIQMKMLVLNVLIQIIVTVLGISVLTAGYRMAMENRSVEPQVFD